MKWGPGFWPSALMLGVCAYQARHELRFERGEQLARRLLLIAATGERDLFETTLRTLVPGAHVDSVWTQAHAAARQVHENKRAGSSDLTHFVAFKNWCVSLY